MAIYDLTVSLDLKQNLNIYATCKQLDSINLICSIYDNSVQADLTNYIVRLKAMKADSIPLIQEYTGISIPADSNVVTIAADEQLTTTAGETPIELQFIDKTSGKKKATFNLILEVMSSTLVVDRSISTATYTLLEELENKLDQTSDFFENISEAVEINNELKTSIASGATLKTGLDTDIVNGNALKTGLENSTAAANTAKNNLDNSISNANTAKSAVDASNTNAQATKTALEADIAQAQSNSFATEITNARGTYANLKARFDANDASLSERTNPNLLINGDFQIWQRGTSFNATSGNNTYTADRWLTATGGAYTVSNLSTGGLRIANTTDFTSNSRFQQHVEVPKSLQGKTVTLSFKVKSSVNKSIGVAICPYNEAVIASKTIVATSASQVYSLTLTLPTGKEIITIVFALATNTTSYFGLTAVTNFPVCNIDFEWVKLELGSIATPFVPRLYAEELASCQRYYEKVVLQGLCVSQLGVVRLRLIQPFKCAKRIAPTVILTDIRDEESAVVMNSSGVTFQTDINKVATTSPLSGYTNGSIYEINCGLDAEIY